MRSFARALLALSLLAPPAFADGAADAAAAESLFDDGRKLLEQGKVAEACTKLEASQRLEPAVGTLLNLGDCNERRAKLASAWTNYRAAYSLALTRNDASRAEFARKKSEALQPRLSTLTITIAQPTTGLRVTRDGVAVDDAVLGTALPIDAGAHVIEATAPGKKPLTSRVEVPEGGPTTRSVRIEPLESEPVVASTKPEAPVATTATADPAGKVLGIAGIGAGAIALGLGAYFAVHAKNVWDDAGKHCNAAHQCDATGLRINSDARSDGNVATALIVTGIVLAAAGTACLLFWPKRTSTRTALLSGVTF